MPENLLLSVPNSNPNSAFAQFEIRRDPAVEAYTVFAIREDGAVYLTAFKTLENAKEFLVDLNGPLPENDEDE